MADKPLKYKNLKPHQKKKFVRVLHEFSKGTLKSSSGKKVTDHAQALAIAFSEARNAA
jgi:Family of unknown function (DUF6496)